MDDCAEVSIYNVDYLRKRRRHNLVMTVLAWAQIVIVAVFVVAEVATVLGVM